MPPGIPVPKSWKPNTPKFDNRNWRWNPNTSDNDYVYSDLARYNRRWGRPLLARPDDPTLIYPPMGWNIGAGSPVGSGGYMLPPQPKPLIWSNKYQIEGSPDWWKGLVANKNNAFTQYFMATNAWLPFLSPEDQRAFANNLSLQYKGKGEKFGDSTDFTFGTIPSVSPQVQQQFQASQRAQAAIAALQRVSNVSGFKMEKLGKGYQYLTQVADALRDFGSTGRPMSRLEYTKFISAIDPLLNQKGADIEPYVGLAKAFLQPFFTGGSLVSSRKLSSGGIAYGSPNPLLYT